MAGGAPAFISDNMTDDELMQIEARSNAATPGQWGIQKSTEDVNDRFLMAAVTSDDDVIGGGMYLRDAAFIAAAREDVPALVAEVRRLREFGADLEWRLTEGYREALTLFEAMKAQHYPNSEAMPDQTTAGLVLQISNMVAGLRNERAKLRADVERIGRERDDMARANAELQARLSTLEDDGK